MPRAYRKKNARARKPRRKARSRLADKKINTLVEKRMSQIAKAAATGARAKTYTTMALGAHKVGGQPLVYANITESSNNTLVPLHQLPVHDEDATKDLTGHRLGNEAWIRGFKVSGCLSMVGSSSDMEQCKIQLALFSQKRQADPLAAQVLTDLPDPPVFNPLSGASPDEDQKQDAKSITILARKTFSINPKRSIGYCQPFNFSHYFKKPQKNYFEPSDVSGTNPLTRTYWLTAFADRDLTTGSSPPRIVAEIRTFYFTE